MVRTYHRKTTRASSDLKQMELAGESVRSGKLSIREASTTVWFNNFGSEKDGLPACREK